MLHDCMNARAAEGLLAGTAVSEIARRRPALLASVTDLHEAELAFAGGADLIDLKNPHDGALGALPLREVRAIARQIVGRRPVSATVGDPPMGAKPLARAIAMTAAAGVDYVKVGLIESDGGRETLDVLADLAGEVRLIAVLFADRSPDFRVLEALAAAGVAGVMLDTADKSSGGLRRCQNDKRLQVFVQEAHALGLITGLAGSLRTADIAPLIRLQPHYLGFRGALCGGRRTDRLTPEGVAQVRTALDDDAGTISP